MREILRESFLQKMNQLVKHQAESTYGGNDNKVVHAPTLQIITYHCLVTVVHEFGCQVIII